jgi:hypothetical protein
VSSCRHSVLEKLIGASVRQRCNSSLDRKAGSAEKNLVSARDEIALLHQTSGSDRHRGPTITKQPGAGSYGGVRPPEELPRRARVLASPLLSILERPWLVLNVFSNAGSRQSNFLEGDTGIVDSKR